MSEGDVAAFIRTNLPVSPVPGIPEIRLHKASPSSGLWRLAAQDEDGFGPPYWAHHWAGGLALARYVVDHPDVVAGQRAPRSWRRVWACRHRCGKGRRARRDRGGDRPLRDSRIKIRTSNSNRRRGVRHVGRSFYGTPACRRARRDPCRRICSTQPASPNASRLSSTAAQFRASALSLAILGARICRPRALSNWRVTMLWMPGATLPNRAAFSISWLIAVA